MDYFFGDPSVVVRSDTPSNLSVSHSEIIIIGATEIQFKFGESDALVSISRNGQLLASGYTDDYGDVTFF